MVKSNNDIGELIGEWMMVFLVPSVTAIIFFAFAQVFFELGSGYHTLFIVLAIVLPVLEFVALILKTKEAIGL